MPRMIRRERSVVKRRAAVRPARQLESAAPGLRSEQVAAPLPSPGSITSRPPVISQLGPRDVSVLAWVRDEAGTPIYRVARAGVKAASTAAVLARKLQREARS
jgi:hypothetical protein